MKERQGFILYRSFYRPIQSLPAEDKATLLDAVFLYHEDKDIPELSPAAAMAFDFMINQFEVDKQKYIERCNKNRDNIKKRWDNKDTSVYKRIPQIQTYTNDTDKNKNKNKNKNINTISSERSKDHSRTGNDKEKISFNWDSESFENISQSQNDIWAKTYPAVNIPAETLKAAAWQAANPKKRKKDYKKFLNSWFARQQERGGSKNYEQQEETGERYYGI